MAAVNTWRACRWNSSASPGAWASSPMGSSVFAPFLDLAVGWTVGRSRLNAQVFMGVNNTAPMTTASGIFEMGSPEILFGLYCNPGKARPYTPALIDQSPSDGFWLQRNMCTLRQVGLTETAQGTEQLWGVYGLLDGLSESFAERGPCTAASEVYLCWSVFSPDASFWTFHGGNLFGFVTAAVNGFIRVIHEPNA